MCVSIFIIQVIGSDAGQISATDADAGLNGRVRYSLRCDNELVAVEPSTGRIYSIAYLEQYVNCTIRCQAAASDYGFPPLSDTVS